MVYGCLWYLLLGLFLTNLHILGASHCGIQQITRPTLSLRRWNQGPRASGPVPLRIDEEELTMISLMSTPAETKPWFINYGGTPPIVIIQYLNGTPPQLNSLRVY